MTTPVAIPELSREAHGIPRIPRLSSHVSIVLLAAAGYYFGALLAKSLRFPDSHLSLLWPPTAILLAALLVTPARLWWMVLVALCPVHVIAQLQDGVPPWGVLSQLAGNFGQALLAATTVRYFEKGTPPFNTFRSVLVFSLCAGFLAPIVVSSLAAYLYVLSGWEHDYWYVWRARVLSNVLSTLTIVPPILVLSGGIPRLRNIKPRRLVEAGLIAAGLVLTGTIALWTETSAAVFLYAPLPLLVWTAVRFGMGALCLSILLTAYLIFWDASGGQGPFASRLPADNMLSLQLFLITISSPLMLLGAVIQERRDKEDALRRSEARYRALVMAGADMVWRSDAGGQGFFVTPAWQHLTGQNEEDMRDFGWLAVVHPSDRERSKKLWKQAIFDKRAYENELRVRTRNWGYRYFHVHAVPILAADGGVHEWVGANTDITDRKRAEARLRTQYAITRILSESSAITDAAPRIVQSICEFLDWRLGEVWWVDGETNVLTFLDAWHVPSEGLAKFLSASRSFTFAQEVGIPGSVWKNRKPLWIRNLADEGNFSRAALAAAVGLRSAFSFPVLLGDEVLGTLVFFNSDDREPDEELMQTMTNIGSQIGQFTERKRAEEALRETEERLRLALRGGRMGVWDWDRLTNAIKWSKEHFTIMRLDPSNVAPTYQTWADLVHSDDLPSAEAEMQSAVAERREYRCEYRVVLSDGTMRWVVSRGEPIYDDAGQCVRVMGVVVDVTERKRAEEAVREGLEEVNRLKIRLEADNVYLREEVSEAHRYGEIIGDSEGVEKVLRQVEQVAVTDMTVLILGETGTGKELVARAVHARSARRDRPLVKVNCAALPAELIESELFGHEKGAFTGATTRRIGRFELADGGTIFLDEIAELSLGLQVKLLRVLQEGEFERLGSSKTIRVKVRVIAATNRDLEEALRRETFRSDLYYRLNVYPIFMLPLRERKEDIRKLARVFLLEASRRLGRNFAEIPPGVLEALQRYDWPGNVRELQNVIERAALISTGRMLKLPEEWELQRVVERPSAAPVATADYRMLRAETALPEGVTLEELERAHIIRVLMETRWRIEGPKGAAVILGLNPSTLRSRIMKLGIRKSETSMV